MASEIESLLEYALNIGASELIVIEGAASAVRMAGKVCPIPDAPPVEPGMLRQLVSSMEGESGYVIGGPWSGARWRVRYNRTASGNSAVFRPMLDDCPDFQSLGVPDEMINMLGLNSGLVVFTGPSCCGKTTTATAYVSSLCQSGILRVSLLPAVTELPVKVGESLLLKDSAGDVCDKLNQALRSGTDLIWMGDFEGLPLIPILHAAEAGALVVLTVTAGNTVGALEALLSEVPSEKRELARNLLASVLKAVVVQRLLPTENGTIPAWEILFGSQNVASRIRGDELYTLTSIISASSSEGMILMDGYLQKLVQSGYLSKEDAGKYVSNPAVLG
ncbi:MAG: Flp pilus assembly complex ATPase component TadA [Fibrobacter sp.]|nr:Flp pilus assembly complex ATPase component TadA [Fibrobacter sp.]